MLRLPRRPCEPSGLGVPGKDYGFVECQRLALVQNSPRVCTSANVSEVSSGPNSHQPPPPPTRFKVKADEVFIAVTQLGYIKCTF